MSQPEKILSDILRGTQDDNIKFTDLRKAALNREIPQPKGRLYFA